MFSQTSVLFLWELPPGMSVTAAILILRLSFPGIRFFPVPESIGFIRQMTIRDRSPFLYSRENTSMQEIIGSWRNIPWQFPMDLQARKQWMSGLLTILTVSCWQISGW